MGKRPLATNLYGELIPPKVFITKPGEEGKPLIRETESTPRPIGFRVRRIFGTEKAPHRRSSPDSYFSAETDLGVIRYGF